MPNTIVTLEIPEADVARVVKALCNRAGMEVTPANAKPALRLLIQRWVQEEQRNETAIMPPSVT
jgi:hypothetical protein